MRMEALLARTSVPSLRARLGPLCPCWDLLAAARGLLTPARTRFLLSPELNHRCPATILGWPQTRTRIAFGQSVAKPLSSGPRSPAGFCLAP